MKTIHAAVIALFVLMLAFSAFAQESDYEVKQNFDKEYKALFELLKKASTVQDCADIKVRIDELKEKYKAHKEFLDKALVDMKFDERVDHVSGQLLLNETKLGIMQDQVAKIADLETQVRTLSAQVEKLSTENESLLKEALRLRALKAVDQKSIDSLNTVIAKLQSNIAERDKMIFAMVDSVFMQYDKNVDAISDKVKNRLGIHLERNYALSNIKRAIVDNVTFLESTTLSGSDVASLTAEQIKFLSKWKGLGPKLAAIYVTTKDRSREVALIDTMIIEWGNRLNTVLWKTLNGLFAKHELAVKQFNNGNEFHANVISFIDDEIQNVYQKSDKKRAEIYAVFVDSVWNGELTKVWMPLLKEKGAVTEAQFGEIKSKVDAWRTTVQPEHTWFYILIVVVVIALMVFIYTRMKKPKKTPAA